MIISRLEVDRFRNLQTQSLTPHPRFNLFFGKNGQGKTNLLEAVVVLGTLRSFRASRLSELLRFGEPRAVLKGIVEEGGLHHELEVELRAGGRKALLGGKAVRGALSYLGKLTTVLFSPEDLEVARGAPGERRRLLDRAIAGSWPAYYELLRSFQRVLQTRNRVLRDRSAKHDQLLEVYDGQFAALASRVVASRRRYVRQLGARLERIFSEVSRTGVRATLRYRSRGEVERTGDELKPLEAALLEELGRSRPLDLVRQVTHIGPQTDDLEFQLDGRLAGAFGSQGQVRSLLLAFKLAQIEDTFARMASYPVLLLDDVSSELDPERNDYLFEFINKISCQTFVTSTRPELLSVGRNVLRFSVVNGKFLPVPEV